MPVNLMIIIEIVCQYFVIFAIFDDFTHATNTLPCLLTAYIFVFSNLAKKLQPFFTPL